MHGPHEGRWSRRRRTGPTVSETLRSGLAAQARERRPAGSRGPARTGRNPWRGENPREQRRQRRDLSASARRTSGGRKVLQPGEGRGGSRAPFEPTARGQERVERHAPSPRREKLRRVNPTGVRGTKQGRGGRGGSKAPGGLTNPEGATNRARQTRECGPPRSQASKGNEPHGRGCTCEGTAARSGQTLKGRQGQESSKPAKSTSPAAAGKAKTAKVAFGQGQGGSRNQ